MFWLWPRVQTVHGDGVHGTFVCVSFLCGCSVPLLRGIKDWVNEDTYNGSNRKFDLVLRK